MENIYDFGRVSYVPAAPLKQQTQLEKCVFGLILLLDIIKVIVLSIPYFIISLYYLFVSPPRKSVVGQTVLVTGGGNGIGREFAIRFAYEGCNVAIADLDFQAAEKTAKELNEIEPKIIARAYHVDISDTDQIKKLKTDIEKDMAPVDILINNAGIIPMISLREGTEREIERIIQVNISAQLHMTRTFLPSMIARKRGHIVGIASLSALHAMGGAIVYCTTKAAMHNFIIALNEELRQEGNDCIKCTSILPYIVSTRKDLVEASNYRMPLMTPQYTANASVDAILRNELMITIPRSYLWVTALIKLLPLSIQMLYRDFILKEKGKRYLSVDNKRQ